MDDGAVLAPALDCACFAADTCPRDVGRLQLVCRAWRDETEQHVDSWLRGLLLGDGVKLVQRLARSPEWAARRLAASRPRTLPPAWCTAPRQSIEPLLVGALEDGRATPRLLDQLVQIAGRFSTRAHLGHMIAFHAGRAGCPRVLDWLLANARTDERDGVLRGVMRQAKNVETLEWLGRAGVADLWRHDPPTRGAWDDKLWQWCRSSGELVRSSGELVRALVRASGCGAPDVEPIFWRACLELDACLPALQFLAAEFKLAVPPAVVQRLHEQRSLPVLAWLIGRFDLEPDPHRLAWVGASVERLQWAVARFGLDPADLYRGDGLKCAVAACGYAAVEWLTRVAPHTTESYPEWRQLFRVTQSARMAVLLASRLGVTHEMLN